jgi:hypothetical protein
MTFLGDDEKRPGGMGVKLRDFLHEKLADLSEYWYKRGVRRGHIECHKEFKTTGALSARFQYKCKKDFLMGKSDGSASHQK